MIKIHNTQDDEQALQIDTKVDIAQNEPMVNHVFNRAIRALLQNDKQLDELYKLVFNQLNIADYSSNHVYDANDLVWYQDQDKKLYLLKCIISGNKTKPNLKSEEDLSQSGWENENKYLTILDFGIASMLSSQVQASISEHQLDQEMHPLGEVSLDKDKESYIGNVLLKSDLNNISKSRTTTFFPQVVAKLEVGNVIMHGYSRNFGNVMEYDIVFKLATNDMSDSRQVFERTQHLSANNEVFQIYNSYNTANANYQENTKYFRDAQSMSIFSNEDLSAVGQCTKGMLVQFDRNDYVNTYTATISFPQPFIDRNYMVFSNTILSQTNGLRNDDNKLTMVPSANDITFCNKTRQSITAINITFPDSTRYLNAGYNTRNNGLVANTFQCKIIGLIGKN